jgi:hypothetical protein
MAVAIVMDFEGATLEQYDKVCALMGLTPGGKGPKGAISHWCTATDNGIRVTDVWETKEGFEKFAQEEIGPKSAEAGIAGQPEMTFFEVHNHFTQG